MRKSSSKSSLQSQNQSLSQSPSTPTLGSASSMTLSVDVTAEPPKSQGPGVPIPDSAAVDPVFVKVQAANARLMERTPFAIDDAGDEEDESEDELEEGDNDDQVMDEVRLRLRFVVCGLWFVVSDCGSFLFWDRWMRSLRRMIRGLRRRIRKLRMVCL
jgi:hypothetical protein